MSLHTLLEEIKADIAKLLHHEDPAVHAVASAVVGKVEQAKATVEKDAVELGGQAVADVEHVTQTAETQGVAAAEHEAVADGANLAEQAGRDAVAVAEQAAHDPQKTTAVIAGEAAAASEPTA